MNLSSSPSDEPIVDKLNELKSEVEEKKEEKEFKEKPKSKYRSKKAIKEAEEQEKILEQKEYSEKLGELGSLLMTVAIDRMPVYKPLTPSESELANWTFEKVVNKWTYKVGDYKEEAAFLLMFGAILLPRSGIIKQQGKNDIK